LQDFFDELGERKASIRAVSIDMSGGYEKAIRQGLPDAEVCFDPFHVVQLAGRAVDQVRRREWNTANQRLYRAFLLKEELRLLYHLEDPTLAPAHLDAWLAWASRSKLKPFVTLARTLRARRDGILAAIRLGLSNGRMEGLNSKVRLLSHRSFGFHGPLPLIDLIYLCCSGLTYQPATPMTSTRTTGAPLFPGEVTRRPSLRTRSVS